MVVSAVVGPVSGGNVAGSSAVVSTLGTVAEGPPAVVVSAGGCASVVTAAVVVVVVTVAAAVVVVVVVGRGRGLSWSASATPISSTTR